MIYLIATLTLKPGSRETVIEAAKPCIEATRKEPGCIRYDLNADVLLEDQLVFVEQWKTREDLDLHFQQPHMAVWREAGGPYIVERTIEVVHPEQVEQL